jgi:hypothetical protein
MPKNRDRFQKIIAVAINPGAYEDEAISALRRARELVKQDPSLARPDPVPPAPVAAAPEASFQNHITNITHVLLPVLMSNLSNEAYGLGLKSKIEVEFVRGATSYKVNVRTDGSKQACAAFQAHLAWLLEHFNSLPTR